MQILLNYSFSCVLKAKFSADNFRLSCQDTLAYADECYQAITFLWLYVRFMLRSEVLMVLR